MSEPEEERTVTKNLKQKIAAGASWMLAFKLVERTLGLVSTLILARLLAPADFGIVAMALSFIFMAEALTAFGFDVSLIQKPEASVEDYNTAWSCNLLLGLSIAALMMAFAPFIANFYRTPEVALLVTVLAIGPLISGFENIGVVTFRRDLLFKREFVFQLTRKVVGFAIVVPLAIVFRSYWALVAGMIAAKTTGTILSYAMHPFRPRFTLSRFKELFRFSRWMLLTNVVGFLKERSSDFFIGRLNGAPALGLYNISYELATLPASELSAPINRALLPGFARMTLREEIATAFRQTAEVMALFTVPAAAGIFAVAPYMVFVVLGPKWVEAVPLVGALAPNGALLMFQSTIGAVLIARGKPERVTQANIAHVAVLLLLLPLLAVKFGPLGAAYAAILAAVSTTPIYLWHLNQVLGISPMVFVAAISRPAIASLLMTPVVVWFLPTLTAEQPTSGATWWLFGAVLLGIVVYVAFLACLWVVSGRPRGAELFLAQRIIEKLGVIGALLRKAFA